MPGSKSKKMQTKTSQRPNSTSTKVSNSAVSPSAEESAQPAEVALELPPISRQGQINPQTLTQSNVLSLQNTIGNQAVQRLLATRTPSTSPATIQRYLARDEWVKFQNWLEKQHIELTSEERSAIRSTASSVEDAQRLVQEGKEKSLKERMKSGLNTTTGKLTTVGSGVVGGVVGGLIATAIVSNPIGWVVGGTALASGAAAYTMGEQYDVKPHKIEQPKLKEVTQQLPSAPKGVNKEEEWKKFREDYLKFEEACTKTRQEVERIEGFFPDIRTGYRKMLHRQPAIEGLTSLSSGEFGKLYNALPTKLREKHNVQAIRSLPKSAKKTEAVYAEFGDALDTFDAVPKFTCITKKDFFKYSQTAVEEIKKHTTYLVKLNELALNVNKCLKDAGNAVDEQEKLESALIDASKQSGSQEAQKIVQDAKPDKPADWLAELYPYGYVQIIGDTYAAITKEAWDKLEEKNSGAPALFKEALDNGSIPDLSTGSSGVKWGKGELKVRRTKLTALELDSDLRLSGSVATVENKEKTKKVKVLEFKNLINAH